MLVLLCIHVFICGMEQSVEKSKKKLSDLETKRRVLRERAAIMQKSVLRSEVGEITVLWLKREDSGAVLEGKEKPAAKL